MVISGSVGGIIDLIGIKVDLKTCIVTDYGSIVKTECYVVNLHGYYKSF